MGFMLSSKWQCFLRSIVSKKFSVPYFLFLAFCVNYLIWNYRQQQKIERRMERNATFLAESEDFHNKYKNIAKDQEKEAAAEYLAMMERHGL